MKAKDITYPALFASLTAVGAQISIPVGEVPLTFQVMFVLLSGLILGARLGFLSQIVYLFMGAIGLPVFAGFKGGFVYLYGPTGGYLIAFPLAAFLVGWVTRRKNLINYVIASFLGLSIIYLLGWLRLGLFMQDFEKAFNLGVAPFVIFDFIKIIVAIAIVERIRKIKTKIGSL